jgi:hypothetical protein
LAEKKKRWRMISLSALLSWVMKLIMLGMIPVEISHGEYLFCIAIIIAVVVSLVPSIVQRNYRITLPFELDLLITLSIFLHTFLGEGLEFYSRYWLWDNLLHLFGSGVSAILAFVIVYSMHYTRKVRLTLPLIWFFTATFAMALGGMWEIMEFGVDTIFDKNAQKGLDDTMVDMIYDLLGGIAAAGLGVVYVKYSNPERRKRLAKPLGEVFGMAEKVDRLKKRLAEKDGAPRRRSDD